MVSVATISVHHGDRALFNEISFRLGPRDRIALVGANGAGKSTLMKILVGEAASDSGTIIKAKYVTVGYLPQEGTAVMDRTLYDEVESVFADQIETESRLAEVQTRLSEIPEESPEHAELIEIYGELQHRLEVSDAFRRKAEIEKVLMGLGFAEGDMERKAAEFSGGWQMRVVLARLLLQEPSLLLLDEPTNHLDLESLEWLEEYLTSYQGTVMVVSHDRRFLDTVTSKTLELNNGRLTEYAGNYSHYVVAKQAQKEHALAAWKHQQEQITQTERFVERFRYKATKARQVQSRIKKLEKMELVDPGEEEPSIHFRFPPLRPSGQIVMRLRNLEKRYGPRVILRDVSLEIDRGDRIAFVGVNGAGKSTLARIIAGFEPIDAGERSVGHNVTISYFAQHQAEELNPSNDVFQTVDEVASGDIRRQLRSVLGSFLFRGDDIQKKVSVLSGGEKSRLALAKMLFKPGTLLVLDEPTNHLDMRSKNVLQSALKDFDGSYVIVSHDRDFLEPLVNKVVDFKDGGICVYPGTIEEYLEKGRREAPRVPKVESALTMQASGDRERKRREADLRAKRYRQAKPLQEELAGLERIIADRETRKRECEALLSDPSLYRDGARAREVTAEFRTLAQLLEEDYGRWTALVAELDRLGAAPGASRVS